MRDRRHDEIEIDVPLVAPLSRPPFGADAVMGDVAFGQLYAETSASVQAKLGGPRFVAAEPGDWRNVFVFGGRNLGRGGGCGYRRVDGPGPRTGGTGRGRGSAGTSLGEERTDGRTDQGQRNERRQQR